MAEQSIARLFFQNSQTPKMMRAKKHFFDLLENYFERLEFYPLCGPKKGQAVMINSRDIYSVMAYKDGKAALRVSHRLVDDLGLPKIGGKSAMLFASGEFEYMESLFNPDFYKKHGLDYVPTFFTDQEMDDALDMLDQMRRQQKIPTQNSAIPRQP